MRLNRYVASASGLSRRAADMAIQDGRVTVNGDIATLGLPITDEVVCLDDRKLTLPTTFRYLALNKPPGYVSSREKQGTDPIVYELLPTSDHQLRLAGRLDRDSSGLLLLSDDGDFILKMSHPSADKQKVYELELDHKLSETDLTQLAAGVMLEDGPSRPKILAHDGRTITVSLEEGRNRQLRRTFGALGYGLTKLHRLSIGAYELGDLAPGEWRDITP
ncbi:rRNA pseudouridine synthase [Candidatus Saccharibacteria bacterium]|nr:rRNA pseudouridine synthase [Candidatus Saccharibacteria bacterium]